MKILMRKSEILVDKIIIMLGYLYLLIKAGVTGNIFLFILSMIMLIVYVYDILKVADKPEIGDEK